MRIPGLFASIAFLGLAAPPALAQFSQIAVPSTGGATERLYFEDIDGDGDLDVVLANGGDSGNQQNRVWVNLGGLQGGAIGTFMDDTTARAPAISDSSRDVQLIDFDHDGDPDAYISNHSDTTPQSNRWWINMGGAQGGTAGFFQDQTSTRWVGLAMGPGAGHPYQSSIAAGALVGLNPAGGFKDWSCECGFGDIDNDGDMDLLHSAYGGNFGGATPTRIFLNDGNGFFSEFNPSGFQLPGDTIATGNPGLWCEGTQLANTTNTMGMNCDIAMHALAAMFGDLDNDLDLDIFHGSRDTQPRAFFNRLEETGSLIFRDMTAFVYTVPSSGIDNYEQNLADLDNDFDLDAYLLNYVGLNDQIAWNNGSGQLGVGGLVTLPLSGGDDNEPDFLDIDNDGDLDIAVAAFGGTDRMYLNNPLGTFTLYGGLPSVPGVGLDVDCVDWDNDGDYDAAWAIDGFGNEVFMRNNTTSNDVTPPGLKRLEQAPNRSASATPTVVRVQIYDNSPLYVSGRNWTRLQVSVNGCPMPDRTMRWSGAQIFRGELPGWYVGTVTYSAISTDEHGNTGVSTTLGGAPESKSYSSTGSTNTVVYGTGTAGTGGLIPALATNGPAVGGNADFALCVTQGKPSGTGLILMALGSQVPPISLLGANVNVNLGTIFLMLPVTLNANGQAAIVLPVPFGLFGSIFAQFFGFDAAAPAGISSSQGLQVNL